MSLILIYLSFLLLAGLSTPGHAAETRPLTYSAQAIAPTTVVRYASGESDIDLRGDYLKQVLQLALSLTQDDHGDYLIKGSTTAVVQERLARTLSSQNLIDVVALPAGTDVPDTLTPIPVPIRQGLLGWRVLLIRCDMQSQFEQVYDLPALAKLTAGYGRNWADLPVSQQSFPRLVTVSGYEPLFHMLSLGRFDFLHRGLHEVSAELDTFSERHPNLCIEQHLLLHYPIAELFYVHRDNQALLQRLTLGLQRALHNGQLRDLALNTYAQRFAQLNLGERRLIPLNAPPPESAQKLLLPFIQVQWDDLKQL